MKITANLLHKMLISAANALDNNKIEINNMNVFPVPDGDTGINMSLTMSSVKNSDISAKSIPELSNQAASAILRSARGNSGAILSLFFRGMAKAFKNVEEIDTTALVKAFRMGTDEAYRAVTKPTEGTILTVMRSCSEEAERVIAEGQFKNDIEGFFTHIVDVAGVALAKTPEQLPILKEVNVVDAGGFGFVTVLDGMLSALHDRPVLLLNPTEYSESADFGEFDTENITFSYCTECIVDKNEKYLGEDTCSDFKAFILNLGDSVVFIDDESIIKLHVHTNHPGLVMEKALEFGSLATVKIENMRKQHSALVSENSTVKATPAATKPTKKYGFVSVCMGDGIRDCFLDLGVDSIIFGGQTMNPSTQDCIDAINSTPAEVVFVLPNNKNIYMVAKEAAKLIEDKKVFVIESKSIPEGISSLIAFNPDVTPEKNLENMKNATASVMSISVTHAVRDTHLHGEDIKDGQLLTLINGDIAHTSYGYTDCFEKLIDVISECSFITVFVGKDVSAEEEESVTALLNEKLSDKEIAVIRGDQPVYSYIISAE